MVGSWSEVGKNISMRETVLEGMNDKTVFS